MTNIEGIEKLRDVFGVVRELPLSYVARDGVDQKFIDNLTRDKHIVIYGSSKQGKTTLRKHCLTEDDYIVVSCLNTMGLDDLHGAVLKQAGYRLEKTEIKTVGGHWKYGAEFHGEGRVPLLAAASASGNIEHGSTDKIETQRARLELDLFDVNDIIAALKEANFSKYIILEDFHYLPVDTQRNFAFALKAFHENASICFVVVGVWREKNRLIYYNGDLTSRVVSIDVDIWSSEELKAVIKAGEPILNIKVADDTVDALTKDCFESVSLLQEACYRICEGANVYETQSAYREIGGGVNTKELVRDIVNDQAGRYSAFVTNFSEGFQDTELEMYKWLVYAVLSSSVHDLETGLRRAQVSSLIKRKHPLGDKLNEGNITQALQNAAALQVQKSIRPIIFDYDQTTRVFHVVDRSFLIWLAYQDTNDLLLELGLGE